MGRRKTCVVTSYKPAVACFSRELARHKGSKAPPCGQDWEHVLLEVASCFGFKPCFVCQQCPPTCCWKRFPRMHACSVRSTTGWPSARGRHRLFCGSFDGTYIGVGSWSGHTERKCSTVETSW